MIARRAPQRPKVYPVHDRTVPGHGPEADVREIIESHAVRPGCEECEDDRLNVDAPAATVEIFAYLREQGLLREGS